MSKDFLERLERLKSEKKLPEKYYQILLDFYDCYQKEAAGNISEDTLKYLFNTLLDKIIAQVKSPFEFELYHKMIKEPFDFNKFGMDFIKPIVEMDKSEVFGIDNLKIMREQLKKGENVILFANHQSEVDPHAINLLLEKDFSDIASKIIFVAGERVITDALAVPFSMGCNLLCIYSKRYLDVDPKLKHQKQIHNKKVMTLMSELLKEGGKIIYVAPSGGRDRKNKEGKIEIAPFDPKSLEMFYLMCRRAKNISHFYLLTLATYELMPPPETIQIEMGEKRVVKKSPIIISFSKEIDIESFPGSEEKNKLEKRKKRAKYLHTIVKEEYFKRKEKCKE